MGTYTISGETLTKNRDGVTIEPSTIGAKRGKEKVSTLVKKMEMSSDVVINYAGKRGWPGKGISIHPEKFACPQEKKSYKDDICSRK